MNFDLYLLFRFLGVVAATTVCLIILTGILSGVHQMLTLPMRRAESARQFLLQLGSAIRQGRPVEGTLISLSQSRDMTMGVRFHLVAAWMEEGLSLADALAKVPKFLPAQVNAMLASGRKIGDPIKVLPACQKLLTDAVSQTRAAINYLVILTFVITPSGIFVASVLKTLVLPKFMELSEGIGMGALSGGLRFMYENLGVLIGIQVAILLTIWLAAIAYMAGPRIATWFPFVDRFHYWLPWRRKRLQRDFSTMLAILLDSGVPEPEAVTLAADCTANKVLRNRAAHAVGNLKQGGTLSQAVAAMDDSGEFAWRLANAIHGKVGFLKALGGWHEALDAKAFQQEQAAAHGVTSALVLWCGAYVGLIVISVFAFLVSITNAGVLW